MEIVNVVDNPIFHCLRICHTKQTNFSFTISEIGQFCRIVSGWLLSYAMHAGSFRTLLEHTQKRSQKGEPAEGETLRNIEA